ncbi:MAG: UvrB/UvrC motif-containing protein [Patescibacteria group bacterium]
MTEKFKFINKNKTDKLPKTSGVYAFKVKPLGSARGRGVLYIGKAINIRDRVKNHFQRPTSSWEQTLLRQGFGGQVGYIKTNSEIEALILEANLIKKHKPQYNVVWKDDKNYFFVGITKEDFPQIFITHQPKLKIGNGKLKIDYAGPFVDGKALKETLKFLRKVFPYRSCRNLPKKSCLWYHLNRCIAPCVLRESKIMEVPKIKENLKREAQRNTNSLFAIINGKKSRVLVNLKKEMRIASKSQDFEKAGKIRDQITVLEKILAHTRIFEQNLPAGNEWNKTQQILRKITGSEGEISRIEAYDISNIQGKEATGSMVTFIDGKSDKNFYRKFKIHMKGKPDDFAMLQEILSRRFNHPEWGLPDLILIDGGKAQLSAALACKMQIAKLKFVKAAALAKKKNELFIEGKRRPILLKTLPREIFNLILQLRDEAHRFAISYHRKLRREYLIS